MFVLGIHGSLRRAFEDGGAGFSWHDGAAVLVKDYEIIAAIEEERLNRVKHSNSFPAAAVHLCLQQAGIGLGDVDGIAVGWTRETLDSVAVARVLGSRRETMLSGRALLASLFAQEFGADVAGKVRFCHHHFAHAFSAFYAANFDRSLVVTLDGDGDGLCGMVLVGEGDRLRRIRDYPESESLGNWYTTMIRILGYSRFDEYKVMGLAPYGDPKVYGELFRSFYRLLSDGGYELQPFRQQLAQLGKAGLLAHLRRSGEPFTEVHKNFAAALQVALEEIVFHILRHFQRKTGEERLCLAGGVAHNCSLNGRLLYSGLFKEIFVQPAAHDAGTALGAAWSVLHEEGVQRRRQRIEHLYFGTEVGGDEEIRRALDLWKDFVSFEKLKGVEQHTAQLLAEGAVVGWVQGRSEFGPRALGNRSILADPRPAENKERINRMVKKREGYRPFAPSVQEERIEDFFVVAPGQREFPFMIFVLQVQAAQRPVLGAVTHVDGTARVHTVSKHWNPRYWELLEEFGRITGVPVLLNTSFNNNAEPIVDSVEDAVVCFLTTDIDYMVVDNFLVRKRESSPSDLQMLELVASLPPTKKLVRRTGRNGDPPLEETSFLIESTANEYFGEHRAQISRQLFHLLLMGDGQTRLGDLARRMGVSEAAQLRSLTTEVAALWAQRMLRLRPLSRSNGRAPYKGESR